MPRPKALSAPVLRRSACLALALSCAAACSHTDEPADSGASTAQDTASQSAPATPSASSTAKASPGARPGAQVEITDTYWLAAERLVTKTVSADGGDLTINEPNQSVRIEGDVATLTVESSSTLVVLDYASSVVVNGDKSGIFVRDVEHVTFGTGADNDIAVWAGNTPTVEDKGSGSAAFAQGTMQGTPAPSAGATAPTASQSPTAAKKG